VCRGWSLKGGGWRGFGGPGNELRGLRAIWTGRIVVFRLSTELEIG
jgi:hypothetical protein